MVLMTFVSCGDNTVSINRVAENEVLSKNDSVLSIKEQGVFSAGEGTVTLSEGTFDISNYYISRDGSTSHVDHANVFYQIPLEEIGLPMVFLHGYGQSRVGFMTRRSWTNFSSWNNKYRAFRSNMIYTVSYRNVYR